MNSKPDQSENIKSEVSIFESNVSKIPESQFLS